MNTEAKQAKQELRAQLKTKRAALAPEVRMRADAQIARSIIALSQFEKAPLVLTYLSFGTEVDTRALIDYAWLMGKQVALPKCQPAGRLSWHVVKSLEDLVPSSFGMDEPDESLAPALDLACVDEDVVAFVPGFAFTKTGYRLGYGGGFYDRFLAEFSGTSIGLCRAAFLCDTLPVEAYDLPVDIVVTD